MKRGSTGIVVSVIVVAVLALGLVFLFTDNVSPTGYAGSPTGAVTAFIPQITSCSSDADCTSPETCQYYEEYDGYYCGENGGECDSNADCEEEIECGDGEEALCEFPESSSSECECVDPCSETNDCQPSAEDGDLQCGGVVGGSPAAKPCVATDPDGENGGCDCDMDGCPKGASCTTFGSTSLGVLSHPYDNPCGTGHCEITGVQSLFGECVCTAKECEFTDDDDKDACPGTVKCDEGKSCTNGAQCGGPGVGACINGECDCGCVSWAPCESDDDCGAGECVTGDDGSFECMCASEFGCSFDQCVPGVTPCDDSDDCFGGGCQTSGEAGACEECGIKCGFECNDDNCPNTETQDDCDAVGEALGGAECTLDSDCDCVVPTNVCSDDCVLVDGIQWCPD